MNINIDTLKTLITPNKLISSYFLDKDDINFIEESRKELSDIINKKKNKTIVIVGPCSIHNINSAKEYALFLKKNKDKFENLFIVMRVYFEKPRTTIGWKGFIYDPKLDNSNDINLGFKLARELLVFLVKNRIPVGTEFLDSMTPQYLADLVTWAAIGARTTASQIHRQLASGLSMPVGFKNDVNGNIDIAIDSIQSANNEHSFMGINSDGLVSIVNTKGNKDCHIILRGSKDNPNYFEKDIFYTTCKLGSKRLKQSVMIDCSHDNSFKLYKKQIDVCKNVCKQMVDNQNIIGVMIESNLVEGKQNISDKLVYGQSITDGCINLDDTLELLTILNLKKLKF